MGSNDEEGAKGAEQARPAAVQNPEARRVSCAHLKDGQPPYVPALNPTGTLPTTTPTMRAPW